jgi:tRNA(fMet)-specific endonuclease VapC
VYLLDANACIRILNNTSPSLIERLAEHEPSAMRLSSVVKAELLFGARRSERVQGADDAYGGLTMAG